MNIVFDCPHPFPLRNHWEIVLKIVILCMCRITWPVTRRSKTTTCLEFLTPLCLFTIQHLWGYDDHYGVCEIFTIECFSTTPVCKCRTRSHQIWRQHRVIVSVEHCCFRLSIFLPFAEWLSRHWKIVSTIAILAPERKIGDGPPKNKT